MDVLIEHAERDVGQQRGQDPSLRGPGRGVPLLTELGEDPGLEERLDQGQHALVLHPRPDPAHQGRVVDGVETRLDVRVQHPPIALGAEQVNLRDRVVRPPPGPEPVGDRHEVGLEDRFQHQLQRRLHHPVSDGGDAEPAHLPATAGLGDHAFPDRHRTELARLHRVPQIVQEFLDASLVDVAGPQAVDPGGPGPGVARDPLPRHLQRGRVVHEVEQVVEPAARIGRRPTVQLGLHPQYPRERPLGTGPSGAPVFTNASLGIAVSSLLVTAAALRHVTGSPGLGLLRRLRPVPTRSVDGGPSPTGHAGMRDRSGKSRDGSRVHCDSLDEGGARLCPCGLATATPQHFTVASDRTTHGSVRSSPTPPAQIGRHSGAGARRSRPTSARFGAGSVLRDFVTPVPRVLLSVTLAGPAPSGSASTPRRCQDCSRPPRHLPDQAVLSFTALLRQDGGGGLSPPLESTAPHGAPGGSRTRA